MDLDSVPQRETGMTPYEIMLSESQERMLMVLEPGSEEAARAVFEGARLPNSARFVVQDVLAAERDASADLVLCNPPFHQGQAVTRRVAAQMFVGAARVLRPGGRLLVVGNRHLEYHRRLPRYFARVATVRSNPSFVVLEATR